MLPKFRELGRRRSTWGEDGGMTCLHMPQREDRDEGRQMKTG